MVDKRSYLIEPPSVNMRGDTIKNMPYRAVKKDDVCLS